MGVPAARRPRARPDVPAAGRRVLLPRRQVHHRDAGRRPGHQRDLPRHQHDHVPVRPTWRAGRRAGPPVQPGRRDAHPGRRHRFCRHQELPSGDHHAARARRDAGHRPDDERVRARSAPAARQPERRVPDDQRALPGHRDQRRLGRRDVPGRPTFRQHRVVVGEPARGAVPVGQQRGIPRAVSDRRLLRSRPDRRVHLVRPSAVADGRVQPALAGPAAAQRRHPAQRRLQPPRVRGGPGDAPHRVAVRPHRGGRAGAGIPVRPGRSGPRAAGLAAGHPRRDDGPPRRQSPRRQSPRRQSLRRTGRGGGATRRGPAGSRRRPRGSRVAAGSRRWMRRGRPAWRRRRWPRHGG